MPTARAGTSRGDEDGRVKSLTKRQRSPATSDAAGVSIINQQHADTTRGARIVNGVPSIERLTFALLVFAAGSWDDAPRVDRSAPVDVRLVTWNV